MNNHASLSNQFVQHPQSAFSLAEMRLFNAAICCLHRKTVDLSATYFIKVKDVASTGSIGYKALAEAIVSLNSRRWFNKPLFSVLQWIKNEGVIEVRFNSELTNHLLHDDEYYTTINVAHLVEAGVNHALSLRLLWILRSYYRPLAKVKEKYLTIKELEELLFNGEPVVGGYSKLKAVITAAVKVLQRAGYEVTATTKKRGLIAKGIIFTIPTITLSKKSRAKKAIEAAQDTIVQVFADVVAVAKEVAVVAPVAAVLAVAPVVVEAAVPVLKHTNSITINTPAEEPAPEQKIVGNLGNYIKQVVNAAKANSNNTTSNTLVIAGFPAVPVVQAAPPQQDKYTMLYNALTNKWQLANWQVNIIKDYINNDNLKYEKVRDVIRIINNNADKAINNFGAVVWSTYTKQIPAIKLLAHQKYNKS